MGFKVKCECGCEQNYSNATMEFINDKIPSFNLKCICCDKKILIIGVDVDKYDLELKKEKEIVFQCKLSNSNGGII